MAAWAGGLKTPSLPDGGGNPEIAVVVTPRELGIMTAPDKPRPGIPTVDEALDRAGY
jgi:hypothetical protein